MYIDGYMYILFSHTIYTQIYIYYICIVKSELIWMKKGIEQVYWKEMKKGCYYII